MTAYDEFRVVLTPDTSTSGSWNVVLDVCPDAQAGLVGSKGSVKMTVTRQQLDLLRSRTVWQQSHPKILRDIGNKVWESLMTYQLGAAFETCLNAAKTAGRGLRLVVSMIGEEPQPAAGAIRLQELPLEALYTDAYNFLATDPSTPVSRSLRYRPDRNVTTVRGPLRILVLMATPTDQPPAGIAEERRIIKSVLDPLVASGDVEYEVCDPPTRIELLETRLKKGFHVLHFVGHGAFDYEGEDPSPLSYICLEMPDHTSDKLDADTMDMMLRNSGIRLVVLSACSTAAPTPKQVSETISPFDGVAQRLVAGVSEVNAAVAMQFDLESEVVEKFNDTLYRQLLLPDVPLDVVVTECRRAMMSKKNVGHRCWVNPVVYWRCKEGKLFNLQGTQIRLSDQANAELRANETILNTYLTQIANMHTMPAVVSGFLQPVDETLEARCQILREAVRLRGGPTVPGQPAACPLILHLPTAARIGDVQVGLHFPEDKVVLDMGNIQPGGQTQGNPPFAQKPKPGECTLLVQNASQGVEWPAGKYELAMLSFKSQPGVASDRLDLVVSNARVQKDGAFSNYGTVNGFLFVS